MSLSSLLNIRSIAPDLKRCISIISFLLALFFANDSYANVVHMFSGEYELRWVNFRNASILNEDIDSDISYFDLRFTLDAKFMINENTKGVVALQTGHTVFGIDADNTSDESVPGDDSIDLKLKSAYVDFVMPNSVGSFIVGLQPVTIFESLMANEDAWGITYLLEADRHIQVNFVKIYENEVNEDNFSKDHRDRTSMYYGVTYENTIFKVDRYSILIGYYIDKNAFVDSVMYTNRRALYYGLWYKWRKYGIDSAFVLLYDKGRKRHIDPLTSNPISEKSSGYLVDLSLKREFTNFDLNFEFLLATGDESADDEDDSAFMPIDGLVNFYDRAYILSGYITKDDIDEKDGIFDQSVYRLTNLVFFRLGTEVRFSEDKWLDLAVMYAINDKSVTSATGRRTSDIGGEIDATFSVDLFDTYRDTGRGLVLNLFGAYFVPGNNYDNADGTEADDIYILGTGLNFTF